MSKSQNVKDYAPQGKSGTNKIETETESDLYSSSDNKEIIKNSLHLKNKDSAHQGVKKGNTSADDIPKKEAPQAKKKSDLGLRVLSSTIIISFMCLCYSMGHLYYALLLLCVGFKSYFELLKINKNERKEARIYIQNFFDWLVPLTFSFYLLPYTLVRRVQIDNDSIINFQQDTPRLYAVFFRYHSFICSMLLILVLVVFTLSLEQGSYRYQFKRLGWQIMVTMSCISAPLFFGYYVFKGYYWVIMCNGSVMMNDIMAYVFGRTFGKTKLIALSPNKTVEGFVGGGLSTIILGVWISGFISQFKQITCPQTEINIAPFRQLKCETPDVFIPYPIQLPLIGTVMTSDAQFHAMIIVIFSSVIAPFGGFLASGLKRSLKIKDFSDSIPGHGGMADRFDCHIVCAFFVYMYLTQVVYRNSHNIERIFDYIQKMDDSQRQAIFMKLQITYNLSEFVKY